MVKEVKKQALQSKNIFKFKQFEVDQSGCAMKINTDGVLLAALIEVANPNNPSHPSHPSLILDIGTGTGVIALMLAQRFEKASIHAVEIDGAAAETAGNNFKHSIFSHRLSISNMAIQQYHNTQQFDLIVSNPPYFVNDLKNKEEKKGIARHANELFFNELMVKVEALLLPSGVFWFILPTKQADLLIKDGAKYGLWPAKIIQLHSDHTKPEFRRIVGLGRTKTEPLIEHFYIYKAEKVYTDAYNRLLEAFFLRLEA